MESSLCCFFGLGVVVFVWIAVRLVVGGVGIAGGVVDAVVGC